MSNSGGGASTAHPVLHIQQIEASPAEIASVLQNILSDCDLLQTEDEDSFQTFIGQLNSEIEIQVMMSLSPIQRDSRFPTTTNELLRWNAVLSGALQTAYAYQHRQKQQARKHLTGSSHPIDGDGDDGYHTPSPSSP